MQIAAAQIDDFKTDRKDIMPPLAMVFRLVPILFYGALAFMIVISGAALYQSRVATQRRDAIRQKVVSLKSDIAKLKSDRAALEARIREATDLENWVLASMPLQPLIVAIVRSMAPNSSIVQLKLERDAETPSQLRIGLKLNTISDKQIEQSLGVIRGLNYREFNPTQTRIQGNIDYKASLLWQDPFANRQTPEERRAQAGDTP